MEQPQLTVTARYAAAVGLTVAEYQAALEEALRSGHMTPQLQRPAVAARVPPPVLRAATDARPSRRRRLVL
jgi:hypothetical protein